MPRRRSGGHGEARPLGARVVVARSRTSEGRVTVNAATGAAGASFVAGRVDDVVWTPVGARFMLLCANLTLRDTSTGALVASLPATAARAAGFAADGAVIFITRDAIGRWDGTLILCAAGK